MIVATCSICGSKFEPVNVDATRKDRTMDTGIPGIELVLFDCDCRTPGTTLGAARWVGQGHYISSELYATISESFDNGGL